MKLAGADKAFFFLIGFTMFYLIAQIIRFVVT